MLMGRRDIIVGTPPGATIAFESPGFFGRGSVPFQASIRAVFGDATGRARLQRCAALRVTSISSGRWTPAGSPFDAAPSRARLHEHRRRSALGPSGEENIITGWGATTSSERMSERNGGIHRQPEAFAKGGKWGPSALSA